MSIHPRFEKKETNFCEFGRVQKQAHSILLTLLDLKIIVIFLNNIYYIFIIAKEEKAKTARNRLTEPGKAAIVGLEGAAKKFERG